MHRIRVSSYRCVAAFHSHEWSSRDPPAHFCSPSLELQAPAPAPPPLPFLIVDDVASLAGSSCAAVGAGGARAVDGGRERCGGDLLLRLAAMYNLLTRAADYAELPVSFEDVSTASYRIRKGELELEPWLD